MTEDSKTFKLLALEPLDLEFIKTTELLVRKLSGFPQLVFVCKLHHLLDWVKK